MSNIQQIMQQAQAMQARMAEMQEKLNDIEITAQAGSGLVTVIVNGKSDLKAIKLDPKAVTPDDIETLEDLIKAAVNNAKQQVEAHIQGETQKIMKDLGLPQGGA